MLPFSPGVIASARRFVGEGYLDAVSGAKTFVSGLLSGAFPWTPINMHIDDNFEITKVKREAYGPAIFGGYALPDTDLYANCQAQTGSTPDAGVPANVSLVVLNATYAETATDGGVDYVKNLSLAANNTGSTTPISGTAVNGTPAFEHTLNNEFVVAVDFRFPVEAAVSPSNQGMISGNGSMGSFPNGFRLYKTQDAGTITVSFGDQSSIAADPSHVATTAASFADGDWHTAFVQRVNGVTTWTIQLFIDGLLVAETVPDSDMGYAPASSGQSNSVFLHGIISPYDGKAFVFGEDGKAEGVGNCRVWYETAFTPEQILRDYNTGTLVDLTEQLYTATYVGNDILVNGELLFTQSGILDFDLSFNKYGYPVVAYETATGIHIYDAKREIDYANTTTTCLLDFEDDPIVDAVGGTWSQTNLTIDGSNVRFGAGAGVAGGTATNVTKADAGLTDGSYTIEFSLALSSTGGGTFRLVRWGGPLTSDQNELLYDFSTNTLKLQRISTTPYISQVLGMADDVYRDYAITRDKYGVFKLYIDSILIGSALGSRGGAVWGTENMLADKSGYKIQFAGNYCAIDNVRVTDGVARDITPIATSYTVDDVYTPVLAKALASKPFICIDTSNPALIDDASNIVAYKNTNSVAYKLSHEDYSVERMAADITGGGELVKMGMVDDGGDKRLAMKFTPPAIEV